LLAKVYELVNVLSSDWLVTMPVAGVEKVLVLNHVLLKRTVSKVVSKLPVLILS
jgi:hypothetical protein